LLKTHDISCFRGTLEEVVTGIEATIHVVAVDTDLFFTAQENRKAVMQLASIHENIYYHEIQSIHGHDAFLIEFEQLIAFLKPVFCTQKQLNYAHA